MKYASRICFLILALTIFAGAGRVAAGTTIKLATLAPEGSELYTAIKNATEQIEQETGEELQFKIYPGGVMGNDSVVLRKMQSGQIQGSTFTAGGMALVYPDFQIMTMPMLIRSYAEIDAVRKKFDTLLIDNLAKKKMYAMAIMGSGFVYIMSQRPLRGVSDLKGLKIWVPEGDPISRMVFENAGVPPVPLQLPDVLTGLQTGLIDTVSNSPVGTIVFQWFTKVKYLTDTPLMYSYGTFAFSERGWGKIPDKYKGKVREIFSRNLKTVDDNSRHDNEAALQAIKNQGIEFVSLDQSKLPELQRVADRAIAQLVTDGLLDPTLLAQIRTIVDEVRRAEPASAGNGQ